MTRRPDQAPRDHLNAVAAALAAFGQGDLEARAEVLGSSPGRHLAVAFNRMAERVGARQRTLEALAREHATLLATLTHELRTPLAVILAQADLIADQSRRRPEIVSGAHIVKESATQLLGALNRILALVQEGSPSIDIRDAAVTRRGGATPPVRTARRPVETPARPDGRA